MFKMIDATRASVIVGAVGIVNGVYRSYALQTQSTLLHRETTDTLREQTNTLREHTKTLEKHERILKQNANTFEKFHELAKWMAINHRKSTCESFES